MSSRPLPEQTDVLIIGGGVIGCSVAYHLAKRGLSDVLLLERDRLTSGTTWHAAGLVGQLRATRRMTELALYSIGLYGQLEQETGQATGFKQNGSITVATNTERWEEIRRGASIARSLGIHAELVSPSEVMSLFPMINTTDVVGGIHFPKDGQINPVDLTMAFAKGARNAGARIEEQTAVEKVLYENGHVTGVLTRRGPIKARVVVNCAGMWARQIGLACSVDIPLHACEHFYALTEPMAEIPPSLPVLRDPDGCAYFKEDAGKLLIGAFEPRAKPWGMQGIPNDFSYGELAEDLEHFMPILEGAMVRVPALQHTGIQTLFNGPESFTPDDHYLLGEAPNLRGLFVAAGFNSVGIQSAAGAGLMLAEWIDTGKPPADLWDVDIRRTFSFQNDGDYLRERVSETLGLLYAMHWPFRQYETSRGILKSPLHEELQSHGACFGEVAGWERANWFAVKGMEPRYEYTYGRQNWFECAAAEHRSVRESVALFDQSSFAKFDMIGAQSTNVLQRICTNDVDVEPGSVVYTQWLNDRGGIESDVTVTRLAEDRYRVVTSAATARRDYHWLLDHIPKRTKCELEDVTDRYAVLSVMGPNSRSLLADLGEDDWSNRHFPFATAKPVQLGGVPVFAQRITYVGELGWELYVSREYAVRLFQLIHQVGRSHGLQLAGYHALDSCRMEKGYRSWGHDITDRDTPVEAGLAFTCAMDKSTEFIGQQTIAKQKTSGVRRRLTHFRLRDPEPLLYHDEPIFRQGRLAGYITSGSYGHTLGSALGLGYINGDETVNAVFVNAGTYEIEVAGQRYQADASLRPWYDPKNNRVRS